MKITNWGNYPVVDAELKRPRSLDVLQSVVTKAQEIIPRGLGRCYGDSSLNHIIISTERLDHFLDLDEERGIVTCEAGVSLGEILDVIVPKGWFLPVTPGTKFVTVGGAIAADVHGKNHHIAGSFSRYVVSMSVMLADGSIVECSAEEKSDLFWATCGGMGLTGIVIAAAIALIRIETASIRQRIVKSRNIRETFEAFEANAHWTYSVAWIDCVTAGDRLGRSALILGEHATKDEVGYRYRNPLSTEQRRSLPIPVYFPNGVLNRSTVKFFNAVRYRTYRHGDSIVHYEPFFYPLDVLSGWNKIYGRRGFTQYQCVLPSVASKDGMIEILNAIAASGEGSFLAVLKQFGPQEGMMSFPREGYTLALDFPITRRSLAFLDRLDAIVADHGGRLYLAKDARMKPDLLASGYERLEEFKAVKQRYDPVNKFRSLQSIRLGL